MHQANGPHRRPRIPSSSTFPKNKPGRARDRLPCFAGGRGFIVTAGGAHKRFFGQFYLLTLMLRNFFQE
jgi:hypothetical protein